MGCHVAKKRAFTLAYVLSDSCAENEWSLGVCPTCVGSVGSVTGREAAAESHCRDFREDTAPLTHFVSSFSVLSVAALSAFIPVSPVFISFLSSSLPSLIVSPQITSLSLAASRFLLPLLLFSPPTSPCMERQLTASLLSSTVPLFSPSIFPSLVFQWLCKLSNLIADKVINTTLDSLNIHHSALCIFLPLFF